MAFLKDWWSGSSQETKEEEEDKGVDDKKEVIEGGKGVEPSSESGSGAGSLWNVKLDAESLSKGMGGFLNRVKDYATTVSSRVGEVGVFSQFAEEQEKFQKKQRHERDAAVPPWVGYNEEEEMKRQILDLSTDQRIFLRPPPSGVQFHFEFSKSYPVAMAILEEDEQLKKMRFELVPKKVSEVDFWKNYFYRVSLIKQSVQISTSNRAAEDIEGRVTTEGSTSEKKEQLQGWLSPSEPVGEVVEGGREVITSPQAEFASDEAFDTSQLTSDSVKQELQELGMTGDSKKLTSLSDEGAKDVAEWEAALQDELAQLTLEGEGQGEGSGGVPEDTEAWEKELAELLEPTA